MAQRKPEHSLLQGDRLKRELDAQTKRAQARAYVTDKGKQVGRVHAEEGLSAGGRQINRAMGRKNRMMKTTFPFDICVGCMNVSLTEQVLNRGMYMGAEAQELAVAMGGGMSVTRDNTLEVGRWGRQVGTQGRDVMTMCEGIGKSTSSLSLHICRQ